MFGLSLKKWQLLALVLIGCIIAFMVMATLSDIIDSGTHMGGYTPPYGAFWFDSCENLTDWTTVGGLTVQINTTDQMELFGCLHSNYTSGDILDTSELANATMAQYYESARSGDAVRMVTYYGAWAKDNFNPYANSSVLYFVYWLGTGGRSISMYYASSGLLFGAVVESHGYHVWNLTDESGTMEPEAPLVNDHNWHWYEIMIMYDNLTDPVNPSTWYGFIADGDAYFYSISTTYDYFLPTVFITGDAAFTNHRDWEIDYLRTSLIEEYPPAPPVGHVIAPEMISAETVMLAIGLIGAVLCVVSPVYSVETFMEGRYIDAFGFGFLGMLLGVIFIIVWLF